MALTIRPTSALAMLGLCTMLAGTTATGDSTAPPIELVPGLLDPAQPATLGLTAPDGVETITIHRPVGDGDNFTHGVVLMPFRGRLYAQWQSSHRDEDGPDTHVMYSVSEDGADWSEPRTLAPTLAAGIRTSGGWWTDGETLVAYINEWPDRAGVPEGGFTVYATSSDGESWSDLVPVTTVDGTPIAGVIEQDPRALVSGRVITAFHSQPGLIVAPWYTDDPLGVSGWRQAAFDNLPHDDPDISRELEPSWYRRPGDDALVMVFRDQAGCFCKLAAVSRDRGESWTRALPTNVPDARTKQSAGNLPDGTAYLAGNPNGHRDRFPLVLLLSADGRLFDRGWLLRAGGDALPPVRFEGRYKRPGYSYPKSVVWNDHLYVAYATGKEDAEISRVPLSSLSPGK